MSNETNEEIDRAMSAARQANRNEKRLARMARMAKKDDRTQVSQDRELRHRRIERMRELCNQLGLDLRIYYTKEDPRRVSVNANGLLDLLKIATGEEDVAARNILGQRIDEEGEPIEEVDRGPLGEGGVWGGMER